jgi:hypothetical protein
MLSIIYASMRVLVKIDNTVNQLRLRTSQRLFSVMHVSVFSSLYAEYSHSAIYITSPTYYVC